MTLDFFEGWRIFVSGRGTNIYSSYFCNEGEIIFFGLLRKLQFQKMKQNQYQLVL